MVRILHIIMVTLHQALPTDKNLSQIINLYESAFPWCERRATSDFVICLTEVKEFSCFSVMYENAFAGFITVWDLNDFFYIEHFAISENLRGKKIGSVVLKQILSDLRKPVILEVEPPTDVQSNRRIDFYEKNGFLMDNHLYRQPSYHGDEAMIPLRLMEFGGTLLSTRFEHIKKMIYLRIYNVIN